MADLPDTERQAVEPDAREVLSVSHLNDRIASVVQNAPALNGVRCIGEITDLEFLSLHPLEVYSTVLTAIEQRIETLRP
jgi:hypothetical protein